MPEPKTALTLPGERVVLLDRLVVGVNSYGKLGSNRWLPFLLLGPRTIVKPELQVTAYADCRIRAEWAANSLFGNEFKIAEDGQTIALGQQV